MSFLRVDVLAPGCRSRSTQASATMCLFLERVVLSGDGLALVSWSADSLDVLSWLHGSHLS